MGSGVGSLSVSAQLSGPAACYGSSRGAVESFTGCMLYTMQDRHDMACDTLLCPICSGHSCAHIHDLMLRRMQPTAQAPFPSSVGFGVIVAFTACQLLYMLGVYGITWAGVRLSAALCSGARLLNDYRLERALNS